VVQVRPIERATSDILSRISYDCGKVGVQCPKQLFQMIGTACY
jgi:hypothetical protein